MTLNNVMATVMSLVALLLLPAGAVLGAPILDQSTLSANYKGGWAITNGRELAQVVTCGTIGTLVRVDLGIVREAGDVEIRIRRVANGVPTLPYTSADILMVVLQTQIPLEPTAFTPLPYFSVDLSDMGFSVSAGEEIAITAKLTSSDGGSPPWTIFADGSRTPGAQFYYSSGNAWKTSSLPCSVQTWVNVPEPATLLLALGGLALLRRRR